MQTTEIDMARIINPNTVHLMMALHWLRTYKIEEELAGSLEMVEKTARKWIWVYVHAIQGLKEGQEQVSAVDHKKNCELLARHFSFLILAILILP